MYSVEHEAGLELARKLVAVENQRDELLRALKITHQQLMVLSVRANNDHWRANVSRALLAAEAVMNAVGRCEGRYPVPQTAPPRDEPFEATYRCGLPKGHDGPHGSGQ